jgi:hypothetical protein
MSSFQNFHCCGMTFFPSGKFDVPAKLSPLTADSERAEFPPKRLSRSVLSVFSDPSTEGDVLKRSDFTLPHCYYRSYLQGESELRLKPQHFKQSSLPSLFYCFYYLPGDVVQTLAAAELSHRGWKYHGELKLWFRQAKAEDGLTSNGLMHFDPHRFEQCPFPRAVEFSKFLAASDFASPIGSNPGPLRSGPPTRLPPASPQSMVPQQAPITPSSIGR